MTISEAVSALTAGKEIVVESSGIEIPQSPISMIDGQIVDCFGEVTMCALNSNFTYEILQK